MAAQKPVYVQLEANEDVPSIRDRLSFIRGQRVLLIWPEQGTALARKLDLILIQREAKRRVLQIALVTRDPQVIQNAEDLNISTFETIQQSEQRRWKRGRTKVFLPRDHKPQDAPEPEDLMPVASRVRHSRRGLSRLQTVLLRLIVVVILVGVIGTAAYAALPGATVVISIPQERILVNLSIIADPNVLEVDVENAVIPSTVLIAPVEDTGTIPTTGIENIGEVPATGRVTFTNQTESAVTIPANTTVSTSAGTPILFRTLDEVTVPAGVGELADVGVEAVQASAGEAANVNTGLINTIIGPLEDRVTVRNLSPTSGGETRTLATVTQTDRERLLNTMRGRLQAMAFTEMEARISDEQYIVIESIAITNEEMIDFSHDEGDFTDTLSLTLRAVVEAVVVNDGFGRQVTLARLSAQIPPGRTLQPDSIRYTRGAVTEIGTNKRVRFDASGSGLVSGRVNIAQLQERLAGRPVDEARQILMTEVDIAPGTEPQIQIWPEGLTQMPLLPVRITIQVRNTS